MLAFQLGVEPLPVPGCPDADRVEDGREWRQAPKARQLDPLPVRAWCWPRRRDLFALPDGSGAGSTISPGPVRRPTYVPGTPGPAVGENTARTPSSGKDRPMTSTTPYALDAEFTATLVRSPATGGWTYVQMPGSA